METGVLEELHDSAAAERVLEAGASLGGCGGAAAGLFACGHPTIFRPRNISSQLVSSEKRAIAGSSPSSPDLPISYHILYIIYILSSKVLACSSTSLNRHLKVQSLASLSTTDLALSDLSTPHTVIIQSIRAQFKPLNLRNHGSA